MEGVSPPELVGHLGQQFGTRAMAENRVQPLVFARAPRPNPCGATPCGGARDGKGRFRLGTLLDAVLSIADHSHGFIRRGQPPGRDHFQYWYFRPQATLRQVKERRWWV